MRCQQATELMSLALDEMLDQARRRELQEHIAGCADCQAMWSAMQRLSTVLAAAPMVGPMPGFAERVMARISQRETQRQVRFGYLALGLGLLFLLLVPAFYLLASALPAGRALIQNPDPLREALSLLIGLLAVARSFLEAFWVLVRVLLSELPQGLLVTVVSMAALAIAFWVQIVTGRSGVVRQRMQARS